MRSEIIIDIEHVTKEYRLGAIGGGTLKGDLQSLSARIRGKADPNAMIGQDVYVKNQKFTALNDVNFKVYKGERVGIIGHNGAGKSTLLKLLSRVTAPTSGRISYNGRIASMLEVGTGFHPELTGRENVYLNGAILGMTKAEIDRKFDDIVAFAEMEKFIDTPVKRYSSGMYVKLAFAVAAHLDSEIMVMDEVLAVGDMKFQQKCLGKMGEVSESEGRTVLYVSHNMNTIRQLCTRCVVLDKGKVVFSGDVEEAIQVYLESKTNSENEMALNQIERNPEFTPHPVTMNHLKILNENTGSIYSVGNKLKIRLSYFSDKKIEKAYIRLMVKTIDGTAVTMMTCDRGFNIDEGKNETIEFEVDTSHLAPGRYALTFVIYEVNEFGGNAHLDGLRDVYCFEIVTKQGFNNNMGWQSRYWGHYYNEPLSIKKV